MVALLAQSFRNKYYWVDAIESKDKHLDMMKRGIREKSGCSRTHTYPNLKIHSGVLRKDISVNGVLFGVFGYRLNGFIFCYFKKRCKGN